MTRAEEPTDSDRAWAGLCVPGSAQGPCRELAISLVASWILQMEAEGHAVDMACGGETYQGTAHSHLDHLAVLSDAQAGAPLPANPPEGVSLLVVARGSDHAIPAESVVSPSRGRSSRSAAVAVVLSDSEADAQTVRSAGWEVVRLGEAVKLEDAGVRLAQFCAAADRQAWHE